jgi:SAM-dependent methyltransferase
MTASLQPCRLCGASLSHVFADLGMSPLSNRFLTEEQLGEMEPFYPLCAFVCDRCFLVQLQEYKSPTEIFSDYAYFSSYSTTWLRHAEEYAGTVVDRFGLDESSLVVEIASNDGYLLQYFRERRVPVLGVEPAANVAAVANDKGIRTLAEFFGSVTATRLAEERQADLLIGNNVLAHVPDLNDFVSGLATLLAPGGVLTMEFPHLLKLIRERQFDTIYHEHFSYLSLLAAERAFTSHGLQVFDVEQIPTHGGSLRVYCSHADGSRMEESRVAALRREEQEAGLQELTTYAGFADSVQEEKRDILEFLIGLKKEQKQIVGYGAPAKGNTLLNFCGIRTDFLEYTADLNPVKQNRYLPGTHIPVRAPEAIRETRPDVVLILPWNLREEIMEQLSFIREWGGVFAARSPQLALYQ